jgi:hypothetical protein
LLPNATWTGPLCEVVFTLPGSKSTSRAEGLRRKLGDPASDRWHNAPRSASGRRGAVADDVRVQEVGRGHSSCEPDERSGAIHDGDGGAKGRGQGECVPSKHTPGSEPGLCVTGAGAHTPHRRCGASSGPEVGAVCGKAARTVLCGGREATRVPTATGRDVGGCARSLFRRAHAAAAATRVGTAERPSLSRTNTEAAFAHPTSCDSMRRSTPRSRSCMAAPADQPEFSTPH